MRLCFYCDKEILSTDKYQMLGIDVPYVNLFFHKRDCWDAVNMGDINLYLASSLEKIYNYRDKSERNGKK